jgi:plasmid stabilization system protein ParE
VTAIPVLYELTTTALEDLDEIWYYISADSQKAADRVELEILRACGRLARRPRLGKLRDDLGSKPLRFWTVPRFPNYSIVYLPDTKPLLIVAILQGNRDIGAVLRARG